MTKTELTRGEVEAQVLAFMARNAAEWESRYGRINAPATSKAIGNADGTTYDFRDGVNAIRRLERKGLVEAYSCGRGRTAYWRLTEAGKAAAKEVTA